MQSEFFLAPFHSSSNYARLLMFYPKKFQIGYLYHGVELAGNRDPVALPYELWDDLGPQAGHSLHSVRGLYSMLLS